MNEMYKILYPHPSALTESLRNFGYSLETAISDIIDNSISAEATKIDINCLWSSGDPWFMIMDNGRGMNLDTLVRAMKFGSQNPTDLRNPSDLGRFGLGLKTASFSQCRKLTVVSKKDNEINACQWDLDRLAQNNEWSLLILSKEQLSNLPMISHLENLKSGTVVYWQHIDRMNKDVIDEHEFDRLIHNAKGYIELYFHRFIQPEREQRKLMIFLNSGVLHAFDPFHLNSISTSELPQENFIYKNEKITIKPYVLPHHNKVSQQEYDKYAGQKGYLHEQGFYVYRNRRLIIKGTWFNLIKKEELTKLLRVKIDIPNSLDHLWHVDVKKSTVSPPQEIREQLKRIINRIRDAGKRVYKQRGAYLADNTECPVWLRREVNKKIFYEINRNTPLIAKFEQLLNSEQQTFFRSVLSLLEKNFPKDSFHFDLSNDQEQVAIQPYEIEQLGIMLDFLINVNNSHLEQQLHEILLMPPFSSYRQETIKLIKERYNVIV